MDCDRWSDAWPALAAGTLPAPDAAAARRHADTCDACRSERAAWQAIAAASCERLAAPAAAPPPLVSALAKVIATHATPGAGATLPAPTGASAPPRRMRRHALAALAALAAVAAVALAFGLRLGRSDSRADLATDHGAPPSVPTAVVRLRPVGPGTTRVGAHAGDQVGDHAGDDGPDVVRLAAGAPRQPSRDGGRFVARPGDASPPATASAPFAAASAPAVGDSPTEPQATAPAHQAPPATPAPPDPTTVPAPPAATATTAPPPPALLVLLGQVRTADGHPISDALVFVVPWPDDGRFQVAGTAADGTFDAPVAPGRYRIRIQAEGYRETWFGGDDAGAARTIDVQAGEPVSPVVVVLTREDPLRAIDSSLPADRTDAAQTVDGGADGPDGGDDAPDTMAAVSAAASAAATTTLTLSGQMGGVMNAVAVDPIGSRVYLGTGPAVTVLDASDPNLMTTIAKSVPLGSEVRQLAFAMPHYGLAVVLADGAMVLLDLSAIDSGGHPEIASRWPASGPGQAEHVRWHGQYALISSGTVGLVILDAADPRALRPVGQLDVPGGQVHQVSEVSGSGPVLVAVAAGSAGLLTVDLADPTAPRVLGTAPLSDEARGRLVLGNVMAVSLVPDGHTRYAYVGVQVNGTTSLGLTVVRFTDPSKLRFYNTPAPAGKPIGRSIVRHGDVLFSCDPPLGLRAFTIEEKLDPKAYAPKVSEPMWGLCTDVAVLSDSGHSLAAAVWAGDSQRTWAGLGGLAVLGAALPGKPPVLGAVNLRGSPSDIERDGDTVWLADGLYVGNRTEGPRLVDITDERRPMQRSRKPHSWEPDANWYSDRPADDGAIDGGAHFLKTGGTLERRDLAAPGVPPTSDSVGGNVGRMAIVGGQAIVSAYGHGDSTLTAVRLHPAPVRGARAEFGEFERATALDGAPNGALAVTVADGNPRLGGQTASLRLVEPPSAGPHDQKVVEFGRVALPFVDAAVIDERRGGGPTGIVVDGRHAFVANGTDGLRVADVGNPAAPALIAHLDHDGAHVVDVSRDHAAPPGASARIATVALIFGPGSGPQPFAYGAEAAGASGEADPAAAAPRALAQGSDRDLPVRSIVRVIDVTDPTAPHVVATYDIPAEARRVRLEGDRVLVSDVDAGLRILRLGAAAPPTPGTPTATTPSPTPDAPTATTPSPTPGTPTAPSPTATASSPTPTSTSTAISAPALYFPSVLRLAAPPLSVTLLIDRSAPADPMAIADDDDADAVANSVDIADTADYIALAQAALAQLDGRIDTAGLVAFDRTAAVVAPAGSSIAAVLSQVGGLAIVPPGPDQGRLDLGLEAAIATIDRARTDAGGGSAIHVTATPIVLVLAGGRVDDPLRRARLAVKSDALAALGGRLYAAVGTEEGVALLAPLAGAGRVVPLGGRDDGVAARRLGFLAVMGWARGGWRGRWW